MVGQPGSVVGARTPTASWACWPQDPRAEKGERVKEHLLLTRYSPKRVETGEMLSRGDVEEILGLKTSASSRIGRRPQRFQQGEPVILDTESDAAQAYDDAVVPPARRHPPMAVRARREEGFFSKIFGG